MTWIGSLFFLHIITHMCAPNHAQFALFALFAPLRHSCAPIPVIRAICGHLTPLDEEHDGQSHLVVQGEGQHALLLQVSLVDPGQKQFQLEARERV